MKRFYLLILILGILVMLPTPVYAHEPSNAPVGGFLTGVLHPIQGLDHLLAMLCVGFLGIQFGKKQKWILPLIFLIFMAAGSLLGMVGLIQLPAELGIMLSLVLLGILVVLNSKFPTWIASVAIGLSAIFHGFAHGVETPENLSLVAFMVGFLVGTALLIGLGLLIGDIVKRYKSGGLVLRVLGGLIVAYGILLLVGLV